MKQLEYYIQRALQCGISDGIDIDCSDLRKPGGLYRIAWVFNKEDLRVPIDVTLAEYVTNLELNTYLGLYKFESTKFSHEATWAQQQGDGGNVSYLQTVTLRLANSNPANDKVIEDASVSELGTTGGAGRQATDSTFTTLVLTGTERYLPKRLLVGGTDAATLAYLNARVI
jgi:hypothetical protein